MKDQTKKYFLCGGVLLALGVVSAGLLAGVNLITAPIIADEAVKKANAGYLEVFEGASFSSKMDFSTEEEKKALSEAGLTPSTVDYYVTAYSDEAKTKEIGKIFHGSTAGRDADLELLVGFVDDNGTPALKKISMLTCSDSFKATFEKNYLDPVNSGSKSYDDLKNIGATVTATAVSKIVGEANKLFSALSGGIVEDPSVWNTAAFAGKSYKVSSSSTALTNSDFSKYYSYFDDELGHNEIGRWYIGKSGDFAAAIALSAKGFEGGYVLSSSYTDVDYKSAPYYSASSLPSGDTGKALTALSAKASSLASSSPFKTIEYQAISLYANGASAKKTTIGQAITGISNLSTDDNERPWPTESKRQIIANSYTVFDKDGNELGIVYEAEYHIVKDEKGADETEAHGGLYFLLGFSGVDYDNPTLTNISVLENSFSKASDLKKKVVDAFNEGSDHSWAAFKEKCEADAKIDSGSTGATISSHSLFGVANLERQLYASTKGGK